MKTMGEVLSGAMSTDGLLGAVQAASLFGNIQPGTVWVLDRKAGVYRRGNQVLLAHVVRRSLGVIFLATTVQLNLFAA